MRFLTKVLDTFVSQKDSSRVVNEYIIYVMNGDTAIKAYLEIGDSSRDNRLVQLIQEFK